VQVVLPASMCAITPMFRVASSSFLSATFAACVSVALAEPALAFAPAAAEVDRCLLLQLLLVNHCCLLLQKEAREEGKAGPPPLPDNSRTAALPPR
jgi:hypothetical protein